MARSSLLKNSLFVLLGAALMLVVIQRPWASESTLAQSADPAAVVVAPETGRSGVEPLSVSEQQQAQQLVLTHLNQASSGSRSSGRSVEETTVNLALVPLLIERHDEPKATYARATWDRRADVYLYDYRTNQTVVALVNLSAGQVDSVRRTRDLALPIVDAELEIARKVLWDSADIRQMLRDQYKLVTQTSLDSMDQLELHALVVHPQQAVDALQACGVRRCAQMISKVVGGDVFPFVIYVDLAEQKVVSILR